MTNNTTQSSKPICAYNGCKKKLTIIDLSITCKCKNNYCKKHRPCEEHQCTYDFSINKEELNKKLNNMKCVPKKIIPV